MGEPGIDGREGRERAEPPEPVFACPGAWVVCMAMLEWEWDGQPQEAATAAMRTSRASDGAGAAALGPERLSNPDVCRAAVSHGSLLFVSKRKRQCGGRLIGGGLQAAV